MKYRATVLALACLAVTAAAAGAESTQAKIQRAMSAGPASISARATIFDFDAKGQPIVLRKGTNAFWCYIGGPGVGNDAFCADQAGMQWGADWAAHKAAPTNKVPGIIYMLRGGKDWSATDPWATKGTPISEPPHWMIMYPYTAASGLPTTDKNTGSWIMWAGTPYAHLMINQQP